MAKSLRVHNLSKEIGVPSKVIVAKCEAEGVPDITSHMSVVKVGLAMTIREWFSDAGEDAQGSSTAVETTEKVKVKKTKKPAKAKAPAKAEDAEAADASAAKADDSADAAPAELKINAEPDAHAQPDETSDTPATAQAQVVESPAQDAATQDDTSTPASEAQAEVQSEAPPAAPTMPSPTVPVPRPTAVPKPVVPKPVGPKGVQNVPDRPDVVKPAGEHVSEIAKKKVKLAGPRVVRVEKPEPVAAPRSRRGPGGLGEGRTGQAPGEVPGISRSRGPARGGGVRGGGGNEGDMLTGGPGGRGGGGGGGGGGKGGRRSLSSRRGRSADSILTGPTQLSAADAQELDAKLKGASGFLKNRRRSMKARGTGGIQAQSAVETGGKVEIEEPITIKALSAATGIRTAQIVKWLFKRGMMANVNSAIDTEAAEEVCLEYDIELAVKAHETAAQRVEKEFAERDAKDVRPRPPVVTVLGHVDHGKTSLLDRIRKADVAAHESGGITQHVGAYRVTIEGADQQEKSVVFLDTPGHAAFTAMRSRGAHMTDVVVLVVAADDGVMPTTIESINHAKAAGVPIVVALNKIDIPGVNSTENLQRIYGQLAEHGLNPVDWGGEVEIMQTSAETGAGIRELVEMLDLQSDVLELTADYDGAARGTVIEAEMQPGRGSVARVLVQEGQLAVGDFVVAGRAFGRVRDMTNDRNQPVKLVGPATPIEFSGIDQLPDAGDKFYATKSLKRAEEVADQYREDERQQILASRTKVTLDNFAATIEAGKVKDLRVVLKGDVQGSVETLRRSLEELGNQEVAVRVLHSAVGGITESDIDLADASDGIIIGFHVTATSAVREMAEQRGVDMRFYRVIYDLTDDITKGLEGMLTPETKEAQTGTADVKEVFRIGKLGNVAGCLVADGVIEAKSKVRVVRDGKVITENRSIDSLRRVKDEVKEVRTGTECGIRVANFDDVKPGDQIVAYTITEVARTLD